MSSGLNQMSRQWGCAEIAAIFLLLVLIVADSGVKWGVMLIEVGQHCRSEYRICA